VGVLWLSKGLILIDLVGNVETGFALFAVFLISDRDNGGSFWRSTIGVAVSRRTRRRPECTLDNPLYYSLLFLLYLTDVRQMLSSFP
jgi:hypothetical protein